MQKAHKVYIVYIFLSSMAKNLYQKIMLGFTASVVSFTLQGDNLLPQYSVNRIPSLDTCAASNECCTVETDAAETGFLRTCTSTTICAAIKKLEDGFKEACKLSTYPKNDLLLEWIKRERDTQFQKDGSYFVCEDWSCSEIEICNHNQCYIEYLGEISFILPCEPVFTYEMWKRVRQLERSN